MNEITPLPWKWALIKHDGPENTPAISIHSAEYSEEDADDKTVAGIWQDTDECRANADCIVTAVNAYPALTARVEALEEALHEIVHMAEYGGPTIQSVLEARAKTAATALKEPK